MKRIAIFTAAAVAVVALAGAYVLAQGQTSNNMDGNKQAKTAQVAFTDCSGPIDKIASTDAKTGMSFVEWETIQHTTVRLPNWQVEFTIPQDQVGKVVCRQTVSGYEFSTHAAVDDHVCVAAFRNSQVSDTAALLYQYPGSFGASGLFANSTGTLQSYYDANYAKGTNYVSDPSYPANRYYKVGTMFYQLASATLAATKQAKAIDGCSAEQLDFATPFVNAMPTLKTY